MQEETQKSSLIITPELHALQLACAAIPGGKKRFQPHILIRATAGTGKTTALVLVHQQLKTAGCSTLGLAYSKKGIERYQEVYGEKTNLVCSGFESLAYQILRSHSRRKRWESNQSNALFRDKARAKSQETMRAAVEDVNYLMEERGQEPLDESNDSILDYLQMVENLKVSLVFRKTPFIWLEEQGELEDWQHEDVQVALENLQLPDWAFTLFNRYEKRRDAANFLLPSDSSYDLCMEPEAVAQFCLDQCLDAVLVDEFHDTKPAHYEILRIFAKSGVSIIAAGDPAQDIFEWRGIKAFNAVERMPEDFYQAIKCPLTRTYRFGRPLSTMLTRLLTEMKLPAQIIPAARSTAVVRFPENHTESEAVKFIREQVLDKRDNGIQLSDVMVIVPSAQHGYPLLREMLLAGINVNCQGMLPYHISTEALIVRGICRVAGWSSLPDSHSDALAYEALLKLPGLPISSSQRLHLQELLYEGESKERRYYLDQIGTVQALLYGAMGNTIKVNSNTAGITHIMDALGVRQWIVNQVVTAAALRQINQSLSETAALLVHGADQFIRDMDQLRVCAERSSWANSIRMTSVLQSKGMEWPIVVLPPRQWNSQGSMSIQQMRERYVAMSRAMHVVYF